MISTREAALAIADAIPSAQTEIIEVQNTPGRTLHQDVSAERDQPPFDRVTMDGIALSYSALAEGKRAFPIQGTQHAGDPAHTLSNNGNCIEIMTGAVRPENTDCIIPVERIVVRDGVATLEDGYSPDQHQFFHARGTDHTQGTVVLRNGDVVRPMDVAIIASCGLATVQVAKQPTVRVISTGNELVPPGQAIEAHQIRLSNGPSLVAMLQQDGFTDTAHDHIPDDPETLRTRIAGHLETSDVLILSGGVSMGKADFVPQVLNDLGVRLVFHKISQRPGKPMWFGIGPDDQAVFALPGNPVSTLVCCRQYVLPALYNASGRAASRAETAVLAENYSFQPRLTCFLPVKLSQDADSRLMAMPVPTNTSGDFTALNGTDGYVELDIDESEFEAGRVVPLHRWDNA